jgi:hypothetical protein
VTPEELCIAKLRIRPQQIRGVRGECHRDNPTRGQNHRDSALAVELFHGSRCFEQIADDVE